MNDKPKSESWIRALDAIVLLGLSAFAFYLTFKSGFRGFYPFDQSIVFDGSYRVLSGQVAYKDFIMPFGPMVFWLHAVFFRLLGVSYYAYVFGAASVNVLATLCSVMMVRLLFPSRRLVSYVAGILTAVWFYPPFGTPWVDQTAFFFSFLGITAVLAAIFADPRRRAAREMLLAASGLLAFLAFISKQNAGAFMLPIYPLLIAAAYLPDQKLTLRRLGTFAVGLGGSVAGFVLWLAVASNLGNFIQYVIKLASELGERRLSHFFRTWFAIRKPSFGGRGPISVRVLVIVSLAVALLMLIMACRRLKSKGTAAKRLLLASMVCVYCICFQHVFISTTLNQPENGFGFVGIIFAIAVGLALLFAEPAALNLPVVAQGPALRMGFKLLVLVAAAVAVLVASSDGIKVSMSRKVHDIFRGPAFVEPFREAGLRGLRWGEPTRMGGSVIEAKDVAGLLAYLKERREKFFIFPDFTILYGLAKVPSPQPLLWFHEGVTYPKNAYDPRLDRWIVEDLKRNGVRIVIIEQVSWFNTGKRLDAFPEMKSYIYGSFIRIGQIGTFSIYEKAQGAN